jgi:hypothetical protein
VREPDYLGSLDDELPEIWSAHDHPGRPFDPGVEICSCLDCRAAIANEARLRPRSVICLKTACDRIAVTAEYLDETLHVDDSLDSLLYLEGDWVRSCYVPYPHYWLPGRARWWSLTCDEDEEATGRRHLRRRRAVRQSARDRRRHEAEAKAAAARQPQDRPPVVLVALHDAVAPARQEHRGLVAAAAKWALGRGVALSADQVALICASTVDRWGEAACSLTRWTRPKVNELLAIALPNWCSGERCLRPKGLPEAVWQFLDFLASTDRLDPESDPLPELRKPLVCYGGLGLDGAPRSGRSPIPCECYRTYNGPRHGEIANSRHRSTPVRKNGDPNR